MKLYCNCLLRLAFTQSLRSLTFSFHSLKANTMKYLLLCQIRPADFADIPQAAGEKMMNDMMAYHRQLIQAGVLLAAGQLADPDTAQRVFTVDGHIKTQAGAALAGDVQIGGYYLLDVPGEAEATGWAAKCPLAQVGSLEVRQVAYSPL
jgi:hypothetical protein